MRSKKFEYFHRDIKQLKTDIIFRCVFSALFLGIFVWQLISVFINKNITSVQIVVSVIVLVSSLLFSAMTFVFAFKDLNIIATIKETGKCVSSVQILFSTNKTSFMRLYNLLISFLTLVTSLVLVACITYSILQVAFISTISFYMPLLIFICLSGYNAIYHIQDEIRTQQNVQEQQVLY